MCYFQILSELEIAEQSRVEIKSRSKDMSAGNERVLNCLLNEVQFSGGVLLGICQEFWSKIADDHGLAKVAIAGLRDLFSELGVHFV